MRERERDREDKKLTAIERACHGRGDATDGTCDDDLMDGGLIDRLLGEREK